jgi:hypothetical protein
MNTLAERYGELFASHNTLDTIVSATGCTGLPDHLDGAVKLRIGLNMPVPIDPLRVEAEGITAGLSFNRRKHEVFIPWAALIGVVSGDETLLVGPAYFADPPATAPKQRPVAAREGNVVRVDFAARRRA